MNYFCDDSKANRIEVLQELRDSYLRQAAQVDSLLQVEYDLAFSDEEGDLVPLITLLQGNEQELSS